VDVFPQVGLPDAEIRSINGKAGSPEGSVSRVFLTTTRLLHWKGVHLGLRAFALARPQGMQYWIAGEGPDRRRLEALAHRLGVMRDVKFLGRLPREEVLDLLGECVALVHPSLHDSGGVVCLEAMAAGKPVICLNIGGPATQVTTKTGFLIQPTTPEETVRGIAEAMRNMAADDSIATELGDNGYRHVRDLFSWEIRGRLILDAYQEVMGRL
jgi:glycosyltransferase involved in cell wall biosynthesis